ncbi:aminotransferase class V-fold PLP-dependent enzyme [Candidatus Woesearchaeota archaeon]|nr:aminotransferase class V-fold PLP-dependent enzyme [Candidatus Woesearchaeota archaeon]
MTDKRGLIKFWKAEIRPRFTKECLNFKVKLINGTKVRYVNLDNAATTSPFKKVKEAISSFLDEYGSVHRGAGQKSEIATEKYDLARDTIREFVGADENYYVILTKNTTEAINQAAELMHFVEGKVLVSDIEHSSNLLPWLKYNKTIIYRTTDANQIDYNKLADIFEAHKNEKGEERIKLLTVVGASNVTGYKPDLYKLAKMAHKYGAYILVDACQLLQHEKINMGAIKNPEHLDFIAFSGHKMYAPYGAGCLVGLKSFFDSMEPYQIGGGNLAYITSDYKVKKYDTVLTHDPGTPNAIGMISIAEAAKELENIGISKIAKYEHELIKYAFVELQKIKELKIYSDPKNNPSMILFDINGFDYRLTAEILSKEYGIGTRAGSFCVYQLLRKLKSIDKKHELEIVGNIEKGQTACMPGVVRASFSIINNIDDVNRLVEAIKSMIKKSPSYFVRSYKYNKLSGGWTHG